MKQILFLTIFSLLFINLNAQGKLGIGASIGLERINSYKDQPKKGLMTLRENNHHPTNWKYGLNLSYNFNTISAIAGVSFFKESVIGLAYQYYCARCYTDRVDLEFQSVSFPISIMTNFEKDENTFFASLSAEFIYNTNVVKRVYPDSIYPKPVTFKNSDFDFSRSIIYAGLGYKFRLLEHYYLLTGINVDVFRMKYSPALYEPIEYSKSRIWFEVRREF